MAKLPREVAPGLPSHATQCGDRRQTVFFGGFDYAHYVKLLTLNCRPCEVAIWAWCLMPNHVHLIAVPATAAALAKAIGDTHRRYSWIVNRRTSTALGAGVAISGRAVSPPASWTKPTRCWRSAMSSAILTRPILPHVPRPVPGRSPARFGTWQ